MATDRDLLKKISGLFLYTQHLSEAFHRSAIRELCLVASEVRIFPLLALDGRTSPYVANIMDDLNGSWNVSLETVPYEFQRGGNQMMRVRPLQIEHPRTRVIPDESYTDNCRPADYSLSHLSEWE